MIHQLHISAADLSHKASLELQFVGLYAKCNFFKLDVNEEIQLRIIRHLLKIYITELLSPICMDSID